MRFRILVIFILLILVIIIWSQDDSFKNYSNHKMALEEEQNPTDFLTKNLSSQFVKQEMNDMVVLSDASNKQIDEWTGDLRTFETYFYTQFNNWKKPSRKFTLILFASKTEFVRTKYCESEYGCYYYDHHTIVAHADSGIGTLAHELVHGYMAYSNIAFPSWLNEGLPMYFEKFYGYIDSGDLNLAVGFHNPWRLLDWSKKKTFPTIKQIVNNQISKNETRLLVIYLDENGWFIPYVDSEKHGDPYTDLLAIAKMNSREAESHWQNYLSTLETRISQSMEASLYLPPSEIFFDQNSWTKWLAKLPQGTKNLITSRLKNN